MLHAKGLKVAIGPLSGGSRARLGLETITSNTFNVSIGVFDVFIFPSSKLIIHRKFNAQIIITHYNYQKKIRTGRNVQELKIPLSNDRVCT